MQGLDREIARSILLRSVYEDGGVIVWEANLDHAKPSQMPLAETLSTEEVARAGRYTDEKIASRFVARRGILRHILASYCGVSPRQLLFREGTHGKPELERSDQYSNVRFNVSSSDETALIAVSKTQEIGVDIEQVRDDISLTCLAQDVCTPAEQRILSDVAPERRHEVFFGMWSRKEACAKACGIGLRTPFHQLAVAATQEDMAISFRVAPVGNVGIGMWVSPLSVSERYRAALAICDA